MNLYLEFETKSKLKAILRKDKNKYLLRNMKTICWSRLLLDIY